MQSEIVFKRRRGGQPGNRNAAGNRGNRNARGKLGNRGGRAPHGNQNARRRPKAPLEFLKRDYANSPEAVEWLQRHSAELSEVDFTDDEQRDEAAYAAYRGMTLDVLAAQGREYELGLYTTVEEDEGREG
jgi:hypothetical protein